MPTIPRPALVVLAACASLAPPARATATSGPAQTAAVGVVLNVRDFGAIGDGEIHRLRNSLEPGRTVSLRAVQRRFPFVDSLEWTMDELAFARAKLALPPGGGTIHFPVGHYLTGRNAWQVWRDNVRLTGDGADRTILATAPEIPDGLSVAPYRHVGWLEGPAREYPFTAESGARGEDWVRLKVPAWAGEFARGDLVFIRGGANRFDQDYGEFNEIAGIETDGRLRLKCPLARDYTLAAFNWAAATAADFVLPGRGKSVAVPFRAGAGFFLPGANTTISIGENVLLAQEVHERNSATPLVQLADSGRGNDPAGTLVPAGSHVGRSRAVLKLTRTTRNFRCENLQIVGRRKAVVVSNSYDVAFSDCTIVREPGAARVSGGLTIDGDGGRFARFNRCRIEARPAAGMQFARSFGGVTFSGCTLVDANVAFTEFNFDCEVTRCTFNVTGGPQLTAVLVVGKSCGNVRVLDNDIEARGVAAIIDTQSDIQSQKHGSEGLVVVRGNTIEADEGVRLIAGPAVTVTLEENSVTRR